MKVCSLMILLCLIVLLSLSSSPLLEAEFIYYVHVPPSSTMSSFDEMVNGTRKTIIPPPNTALLDVIGLNDDTHVKIWDLNKGELLYFLTLDEGEVKSVFITCNSSVKVVSDKRVLVYASGGEQYPNLGTTCIYPSAEGGFRGREFLILPATIPDPLLAEGSMSYNLLIMSLNDSSFELEDLNGSKLDQGSIMRYGMKGYRLWCRVRHGCRDRGIGSSQLFRLRSSYDVLLFSLGTDGFIVAPALSGGFVGNLFFIPVCAGVMTPKSTPMIVIVPAKACDVVILSRELKILGTKKFSEEDVLNSAYWVYRPKELDEPLIIKSSGNITVLVGSAYGSESPEYLGDDIAFMGIRAGEEAGFFAPTAAILFAREDTDVLLDNRSMRLEADKPLMIGGGVHYLKANKSVIIEILGASAGWRSWGAYVPSFNDIEISYQLPKGFAIKETWFKPWMIILIVIAIIAAIFILIKTGVIGRIFSRGP